MTNFEALAPADANLSPSHEATFRELEIGPEGALQIDEALRLTAHLEGNALDDALMDHFAALANSGEMRGVEPIAEWAHADASQNEVATVIKPLPNVETLSDEVRYRYGVAQTAMISHVLGTPWSRSYENGGQRIQHVQPVVGQEAVEGSVGKVQLWPHNEVLPTKDGKIICSKFSTLYAVHNTHANGDDHGHTGNLTATTLYDAQAAIQELSPDDLAILTQTDPPRFKWNGTDIEREDSGGEVKNHTLLSVLQPVYDARGELQTYDLIADLDGTTMDGLDEEAMAALLRFRDLVVQKEVAYVIPDGQMLIWRNRRALHGRREVTDDKRHLVRSQNGEAEYAEYELAAA